MTSLSNFPTLEDREGRVIFHPRCLLLIECYKSSCSIIHIGKSAQTLQENTRRGVKSRSGARHWAFKVLVNWRKLTVSEMLERADLRVRIATEKKLHEKLYSTCASPVVPHPSTGHAHGCLASEIGRDPAFPTRFDRTVDSLEVSLLAPSTTSP